MHQYKLNAMENQSKAEKDLTGNEAMLPNLQGNNGDKSVKKVSGIEYHNYMPKHSSHGRYNIRGIGPDHEPGTMR